MPAQEALEWLDGVITETPAPFSLFTRAWLLAMLDRFDEAIPLAVESNERQREQDGRLIGESRLAEIAGMAGDHEEAAVHLRLLCEWLEERDQPGLLSTYAPTLGRELCALGRYDEAELFAKRGRELGAEDDLSTQMLWRQVQARVHAHRGEHKEAERLAREAVAVAEQTDGLNFQGDALSDLAEVLLAAGRDGEAAAALRDALDCYELKQNIPMARQARERIAALGASSVTRTYETLEEPSSREVRKMPS